MVEAIRNKGISALQQTLRSRGAGSVLVVKPGQLQNLKGIESLSNRLPALHRELTDFIGSRLGIKVTDILCDPEGKIAVMAANPTFIERLRNSNGNLEVLGHKVVWEIERKNSGKLYLLKNTMNLSRTEPAPAGTSPSKSALITFVEAARKSRGGSEERWQALKGQIDSFIEAGIFDRRDLLQIIDFLFTTELRPMEFQGQLRLERSGCKIFIETGIDEYDQDPPAEEYKYIRLFIEKDGQKRRLFDYREPV